MPGMAASCRYADLPHLVGMWAVMMTAMMLLAAFPRVVRGGAVFGFGYAAVWTAFSVLAAGAQWRLACAGVMSDAMVIQNAVASVVLVLGAGLYELTPYKAAFLARCRDDLINNRNASAGARLATGMRAGWHCIGCCWMLMALLFVVGTMNVVAMALLTAVVALEKTIPPRAHLERIVGIALVASGFFIRMR